VSLVVYTWTLRLLRIASAPLLLLFRLAAASGQRIWTILQDSSLAIQLRLSARSVTRQCCLPRKVFFNRIAISTESADVVTYFEDVLRVLVTTSLAAVCLFYGDEYLWSWGGCLHGSEGILVDYMVS